MYLDDIIIISCLVHNVGNVISLGGSMDPNTISFHNVTLAEQFIELESLLRELRLALAHETDYPIFVNNVRSELTQRHVVINALTEIHYDNDQAPNEVIQCPALLGTSAETLVLAARINELKVGLHNTLKILDKVTVPDPRGGSDKVPVLKVSLRRLGHARLQRRQATRRIETIESVPRSATFTWSHARRKQVLSVAEVREQLLHDLVEAGGKRHLVLEEDLGRLDGLDDETPLVRLFAPYCHPRVNLVWHLPDAQVVRKQRRAVVPLLYPAYPGDELPIVRPLPASPLRVPKRGRRRDAQVEERPLVPSMGVYRVIQPSL